ncbi:uncharacterized protein N7459_006936 [Penicillium hispanicum]|uniref:uncharacterized protein n=1 Tax=Penicillium hispanicum TaxID=1080232 RepID=UPI00253F6F85|nr:uncharacterized protein N7459_006936 [Penicillium hispanicum]KAJ5577972.1 hypothetical protein N7459_006936 [Penicillium hispanicum]
MGSEEKSRNPFEDLNRHEREIEASFTGISTASGDQSEPPPYTPSYTPPTAPVERSLSSTTPAAPAIPAIPAIPETRKPIAIPAIDPANDSPFLRAYPPILTTYKLPKESFLRFLDQLNDVMTTSPPMQVLDVTGGILKSVPILFPLHWIGSVVSGLANRGGQGLSKSRADATLRQANRDIFGPRGLKLEIARLDAVAHIAQIPVLDSQGVVHPDAPIFRQLVTWSNPTGQGLMQAIESQQNRLGVLEPWIARLELDVPPPTQQSRLTRFNTALKKWNNPDNRSRGQRGESESEPGSDSPENQLRNTLWLVIRELPAGDGGAQSSARA